MMLLLISILLFGSEAFTAKSNNVVRRCLSSQQVHDGFNKRNLVLAASNSVDSSDDDTTTIAGRRRLVWLTGCGDMRVRDHGGLLGAASISSDDEVVPVFIIDPEIHLSCRSPSSVRRLHTALSSVAEKIPSLVVRRGPVASVLPTLAQEIGAVSCHVVADDVVGKTRDAQRSACQALEDLGVEIVRWNSCLRPTAPWAAAAHKLPSSFLEYCAVAELTPSPPEEEEFFCSQMTQTITTIASSGVPSLEEFLIMAEEATPSSVLAAQRRPEMSTTEPYDNLIKEWSCETAAKDALADYCRLGRDAFSDQYFELSSTAAASPPSLYNSAAQRLVSNNNKPRDVFALREAPTRAFSSALSLGALSPRDVLSAARKNSATRLAPSDNPAWGRSSEGALSDVVEWREWFHLLAERSLALQEKNELATSGGEKPQSGDPREVGKVNYWRWKGQHLVRYLTWPAGKDYDGEAPAMLLVHGFAASAEQWERMVYSLRTQAVADAGGKDTTPPIFAIDLLGFGHSEKPGVSYTQYLWESQVVDFVVEVMEASPVILAGNSIGGGLSCGVAASLGNLCRGLVLCNTAGVLIDPDSYTQPLPMTATEAAMAGNPEQPYKPVPFLGQKALDLFGTAIVGAIYPQIEDRLSSIYNSRQQNADPALVYAIQQGASSPGSPNVIGSGQKLAPNRPLNEVICPPYGYDGPVLVVVGLDDRVSSPAVAQKRAELFERLRPGVIVEKLEEGGGHCPQDEVPDDVAKALLRWLPQTTTSSTPLYEKKDSTTTAVVESDERVEKST